MHTTVYKITKHKFVKVRRGVIENNDNYYNNNNHNSKSRSNNKCWQDLKAGSIWSM
jgi:uridine kinase